MKTRYDTRVTGHRFNEGDKVWLWNPARRKGLSPKLQSPWDGPYTVLNRLNDVVVRISKSSNSKPKVVHYDSTDALVVSLATCPGIVLPGTCSS
ncbi:hypothetical protein X975_21039, partial [Stegodyphus mimosarum]